MLIFVLEILLLICQKKESTERKEETVKMFGEETALGAVGMLILVFLTMIAFLIVVAYGFGLKKIEKRKVSSSHKIERKMTKEPPSSGNYTIFHALVEALKEEEKK